MKKTKVLKKMFAMLLAAVLTLIPLASVSAANNLPEAGHAGSITVHKYLRSTSSTTPGTGEAITDQAALAALGEKAGAGIEFTLSRINFPVTVNTTIADAQADCTEVSTKATDADGEILWDNAADGIVTGYYLLEEDASTVPAGYTASAPAIISVPYALDDKDWNYDIHVYPKNVSDKELVKDTVTPQEGYSVGNTVTWSYLGKVDISKLYEAATPAYGTYKITDVLDSRLNYTSTTSVKGVNGTTPVVTLTAGTDYDVDTTTTPGTVVWELTNSGIDKLAGANATGLEIVFDTMINDTAYKGGTEIENGGTLDWENYNGTEDGTYTIDDDDKPKVDLYNVGIIKTNNDGLKKLAGAQFKIATSKANAEAENFIQAGTPAADVTVTTDADGKAMFAGVPVNASADTTFWLVEAVAPTTTDGEYVRPTIPFSVTLKNFTGTTDAEKLSASITIKNYLPGDPDIPTIWNLPLTGGMGTLMFYAIGAVIMLAAVVTYVKSRKRKSVH